MQPMSVGQYATKGDMHSPSIYQCIVVGNIPDLHLTHGLLARGRPGVSEVMGSLIHFTGIQYPLYPDRRVLPGRSTGRGTPGWPKLTGPVQKTAK